MKQINFFASVIFLFLFFNIKAQVGIGTNTPNSSAILELKSTKKGLLLPRIDNITNINHPKEGLLIYNIQKKCISIYENNTWKCLKTIKVYKGNKDIASNNEYEGFAKENYNKITGYLEVRNNVNINTLEKLKSLRSIGNYLSVKKTSNLKNLEGLNNLSSVDRLYITDNSALENLNALNCLVSTDIVDIHHNDKLKNFKGLNRLKSTGIIQIWANKSLTSLEGLNNIEKISKKLRISDNANLENLNALSSLNTIGGGLEIIDNEKLKDLSGLENIKTVGRNKYFNIYIEEKSKKLANGFFCPIKKYITDHKDDLIIIIKESKSNDTTYYNTPKSMNNFIDKYLKDCP